jgi:hypothetical protein
MSEDITYGTMVNVSYVSELILDTYLKIFLSKCQGLIRPNNLRSLRSVNCGLIKIMEVNNG